MTAGELMTRTFEVVHPDAWLEHVAARKAAAADPLLVCDQGRLIGMLEPRDIGSVKGRRDDRARPLRVRDVMAPDVLYCLERTNLAEAATLMRERQVEAIPVLNADRRPVGIVRLADVPNDVRATHADGAGPRRGDRP